LKRERVKTKEKSAIKVKPVGLRAAGHIGAAIGKLLLTVFLICIITGSIVAVVAVVYVINYVKPYTIDLSSAKLKATSMVYATDPATNKPIKIAELSGDQNRIWVDLPDVPDNLKNAVVSTEDQRFYEHDGVDIKRTISVALNMILPFYGSKQGGSTITQQVVKNLAVNFTNRGVEVKVREIITALDLEKKYTKDQILESYLNTIDLANGCFGMQTAANVYFGKQLKELDLAQCAILAGITQSPTYYSPYTHPDHIKTRQEYVLKKMLELNKITKEQYTAAVAEKLIYVPLKTPMRSWFVDQVFTDVTADLMQQKGFTLTQAQNYIFTQGLQIYTTENPLVQAAMEKIYYNDSTWPVSYDKKKYESAMIIMDYSGRVQGVVGGRGVKTQNLMKNRATSKLFTRQPGSAIKPIGVYGPAIEYNLINYSTVFNDSPPITNDKGQPWPKDDGGSWSNSNKTVAQALALSINTIAVRVDQLLTPKVTVDFLSNKLGISTLVKTTDKNGNNDLGIATAIGAITQGVTVEEMAGAYQVFGNGGRYTKPYTYTKVLDVDGNVVLQTKPVSSKAFSPETATIMNKLLQNNVQTGTGWNARITGYQIGGKTGTTTGSIDRWFAGITPDYVAVVWTGYEKAGDGDLGTGRNPAVDMWANVMKQVPLKTKAFPTWGNVEKANYDEATGLITQGGGKEGWYKADDPVLTAPTSAPVDSTVTTTP
jgi:penicillin-binding protein 1A